MQGSANRGAAADVRSCHGLLTLGGNRGRLKFAAEGGAGRRRAPRRAAPSIHRAKRTMERGRTTPPRGLGVSLLLFVMGAILLLPWKSGPPGSTSTPSG